MRVAILGIGGAGRTLVSELRADERVTSLLLIDKAGDRAKVLARMPGRPLPQVAQLNVENQRALARALEGTDVVVNATPPKHNLAIMRTVLEAGVSYLDLAATGPREPGGLPGISEQLQMHDAFKDAGLTAIVSMGLDPGMTNVLAREAADKLDEIDAIRIRCGGVTNLPGVPYFPLYSREDLLSYITLRPTVWLGGELVEREPMSEEEDFDFPPPIGRQRCFLISHEEVKTLPRFLGKPVKRVDFKHVVDRDLVQALVALDRLGLLREDHMINAGLQTLPFRLALLAALPEPSAMIFPSEGAECVSVEVEGALAGARKRYRSEIAMSQREANRRRNTTVAYCLAAVGAAIGVRMILTKALPGPGVYPAETLPPERVLEQWTARGLPLNRSEHLLDA